MYGDPTAIRRLAASVHDRADDVRREAARLVALLDLTTWTGLAAEAARRRARERAGDLAVVAARHDTAADSLLRHAREVERRVELIARAEQLAGRLLEEGAELLLPEPGHRDWLDLDLGHVLGRVA